MKFEVSCGSEMTELEMTKTLEVAAKSHNPLLIEDAIQNAYAYGLSRAFVPALIEILKCSEHQCHEDVVSALQILKPPGAVDALFEAAITPHDYLNYDEVFGLARKCCWALADIGSPEARNHLESLATNANEIIAAHAQKRLDCWEAEKPRKGFL